jgi:hypothetical protein
VFLGLSKESLQEGLLVFSLEKWSKHGNFTTFRALRALNTQIYSEVAFISLLTLVSHLFTLIFTTSQLRPDPNLFAQEPFWPRRTFQGPKMTNFGHLEVILLAKMINFIMMKNM